MSAELYFSAYIPHLVLSGWLESEMGCHATETPGQVWHEAVLSISYSDMRPFVREAGSYGRGVPATALELELNPNSEGQARHLTDLPVGGWTSFGGDVELLIADRSAARIRRGVLVARPGGRVVWPYDDPQNLEYLQRLWGEARKRSSGGTQ